MLRHITDAASSCSLCFFGCFDVVWAEWKLELYNVNQVKLQMWHQSTLSTMRPGFNTSTTPTPPTILRWQYFLKSWVLFFSKIVHHFLLKANLIFLRSSGQSGDLVTEVVSKKYYGKSFCPKPRLQFTIWRTFTIQDKIKTHFESWWFWQVLDPPSSALFIAVPLTIILIAWCASKVSTFALSLFLYFFVYLCLLLFRDRVAAAFVNVFRFYFNFLSSFSYFPRCQFQCQRRGICICSCMLLFWILL